jgi:hypothetical protein
VPRTLCSFLSYALEFRRLDKIKTLDVESCASHPLKTAKDGAASVRVRAGKIKTKGGLASFLFGGSPWHRENAFTPSLKMFGLQGSFDFVSDALCASDTTLRMTWSLNVYADACSPPVHNCFRNLWLRQTFLKRVQSPPYKPLNRVQDKENKKDICSK